MCALFGLVCVSGMRVSDSALYGPQCVIREIGNLALLQHHGSEYSKFHAPPDFPLTSIMYLPCSVLLCVTQLAAFAPRVKPRRLHPSSLFFTHCPPPTPLYVLNQLAEHALSANTRRPAARLWPIASAPRARPHSAPSVLAASAAHAQAVPPGAPT